MGISKGSSIILPAHGWSGARARKEINAAANARTARQEGVGGRNAEPSERNQTEAKPAALLVESRTPKKSFVFLLEEKIRRAQNQKCEQNFSLVWRALASGGGLASLVSFVQNRFGLCHIIAPVLNFPIFARPIRPREARKGMETSAPPRPRAPPPPAVLA